MPKFVSLAPKIFVVAILAAGAAKVAWTAFAPEGQGASSPSGLVIPAYSAKAATGKRTFDANCAQCHGTNALGSEKGPPLIHQIYNPGHHADESFFRAVKGGVRRHHWNFGDMPPQPQVKNTQVEEIVAYVRQLQAANGIVWQEHRM